MRFLILVLLLIVGCGTKDPQDPNITETLRDALAKEVNRVQYQLAFKDGLVTKDNDDIGDTALFTGLYASATKLNHGAVLNVPDAILCRSRDMAIGVMIEAVTFKDSAFLSSFMERCGNKTPWSESTRALARMVYRFIEGGPQWKNTADSVLSTMALPLQASISPTGYELHLVALQCFLHMQMGNTNGDVIKAAKILRKSQPKNDFFHYVSVAAAKEGSWNEVATSVLDKLVNWKKEEPHTQWLYERSDTEFPIRNSIGHELVFLGKLLLE